MYILYIMAGIFFIVGIGIRYFRWYFLIAGYNTMSEEKKKNVDIEALGKLMGNFCIIIAIILLIGGIGQMQGNKLLATMSLLSILPLTIGLVILSQKYDYNKDKSDKTVGKVAVGLKTLVGVIIMALILYGAREPKIEVENNRVRIKGMYGTTIDKEDIVQLSIEDSLPRILRRTNGMELVHILRGRFILEDIGKAVLLINEKSSPYIFIETEDRHYIINYKDPNKTMELYNKLSDGLN